MASWNSFSTSQKVAAAIGVSAGAAVLYVCYSMCRHERGPVTPGSAADGIEVRLKIPQHALNLLDQLAKVARQTGTCIEVIQGCDSNGEQELTIRGSPSKVRRAQELLSGITQDSITLQLELPVSSVCKIIGQGGERIREIRKSSGAKIHCEGKWDKGANEMRCITITGSREQVEAAKTLIKKVTDEAPFRAHRKEIIAVRKRERLQPPTTEESQVPPPPSSTTTPVENPPPRRETTFSYGRFVVPSPDFSFQPGEFVDVCVSAIESPEHFWVQILGPRSCQLDKLTTDMSTFYRGQQQTALAEVRVGDIVAAPFRGDQCWYRAQVLHCLDSGNVDLYYVDFGDNWETPRENLYPLRSDFLSLPFQAVECGLSDLLPNGGVWSEEALDTFDRLSHCTMWKPLRAKISRFPSVDISCFQVQLYDPSSQPMVDIGQELIRRGFAAQRQSSPGKMDDDTLVSHLLEEVTGLSRKRLGFTRQQEQPPPSDGSIEVLRADADPQVSGLPSPPSCLESLGEEESLEGSMARVSIHSKPSTTSTNQTVSSCSGVDSSSNSCSCSTCTSSERSSLGSSSPDDRSLYSPRGCFYYLTDETTSSSIPGSSCGEVIIISSDTEEEGETPRPHPRRAPPAPGGSPGDDVIVVEDSP